MKAKIQVIFVILTCIVLLSNISAANYSDVPSDNKYFDAVSSLSESGIITGYEDGTFKPDNAITRAESSAIIVRASELSSDDAPDSIYTDVADNFWGRKYIMLATEAGILDGVGNNRFSPNTDVTHNQIIKMVVCMLGKKDVAEARGGWPKGYVQIAYEYEIITTSTYSNLLYGILGDTPATRGDVARYVYNAITAPDKYRLTVGENEYHIGMNASELPEPDEILQSANEFMWYVYGTDTYQNFFAAGVADETVVALTSSAPGFNYNGTKAGDTAYDNSYAQYIYTDQNDNDAVHAVHIINNFYSAKTSSETEQLTGESRLNFHLTNGFRVQHGLTPFLWNETTTEAAMMHSQDMASNDYFSHTGLDGSNVGTRLTRQGVRWMQCGENIAAGSRNSGFVFYDGLVNSAGHRENLLGSYTYAGIAEAYNPSSTYLYYLTQNFFGN